jgi:ATP-dependent DNA helicase RecQ
VCDGKLALGPSESRHSGSQLVGGGREGPEAVREAILGVVDGASPTVGRTRVVEILRGGRSKVVLKYGYDELPEYGALDDWANGELLAEVDALLDAGELVSTGGRYPKLRLERGAQRS